MRVRVVEDAGPYRIGGKCAQLLLCKDGPSGTPVPTGLCVGASLCARGVVGGGHYRGIGASRRLFVRRGGGDAMWECVKKAPLRVLFRVWDRVVIYPYIL